jgi:hypothetical protein
LRCQLIAPRLSLRARGGQNSAEEPESAMSTHAGSCHCGQVAFEVTGTFGGALVCNCSCCRRSGNMLAFTTPENVPLTTAQKDVSTYLFSKQTISHFFCASCGISTHGSGVASDGSRMVAVNLRCVPDIDLAQLEIQAFDGAKL